MSRNYRSDSCPVKFDVLKTSILALEASLLRQTRFPPDNYKKHSSYCLNIDGMSKILTIFFCLLQGL